MLQQYFGNPGNDYRDFIQKKNGEILAGLDTKCLGVRWDFCEDRFQEWSSKAIEGSEVVIVYCMRDLKKLYISMAFNGFVRNVVDFENRIGRSIDKVLAIDRSKVFPMYVGNLDYVGLLRWLDLCPTDLQLRWADQRPLINFTQRDGYEDFKVQNENIAINEHLKNRYEETRKVLHESGPCN